MSPHCLFVAHLLAASPAAPPQELQPSQKAEEAMRKFTRATQQQSFDRLALSQFLKMQGPEGLRRLEPHLTKTIFECEDQNGVDPRDSPESLIIDHVEAAIGAVPEAAWLKWAEATPGNRRLLLELLHLRPRSDGDLDELFLRLLYRLEPQALIPHLERSRLPSASFARLALSDPAFVKLLADEGLDAVRHCLPVLAAESREARLAALNAMPADGLAEDPEHLMELLGVLGDSGLALESQRLLSKNRDIIELRALHQAFLAGLADDLAEHIWSDRHSSQNEKTLASLILNNDKDKLRTGDFLAAHGYTAPFAKPVDLSRDPVECHLQGIADSAYEHFRRYLILTLRGLPKEARAELDAALHDAPHALPILLEKVSLTIGPEQEAAMRALCQALPQDLKVAEWIFEEILKRQLSLDRAAVNVWMARRDWSTPPEGFVLDWLSRLAIRQNLDAKPLLPLLDGNSFERLLLRLMQDPSLAPALLKEGSNDAYLDSVLSHLLGLNGRPQEESILLASFHDDTQSPPLLDALDAAEQRIGRILRHQRLGENAQASALLQDFEEHFDRNYLDLLHFFRHRPELLKAVPALKPR
ncbi:MAG: hypothetical protein RL095_1854 [Verrucomicrobiota bacterium]|jgi:hypothetical protein